MICANCKQDKEKKNSEKNINKKKLSAVTKKIILWQKYRTVVCWLIVSHVEMWR